MTAKVPPEERDAEVMRGGRLLDDPATRDALSRMFGESLLGPWPELQTVPLASRRTGRRRAVILVSLALLCVAVVLLARALIVPGLARKEKLERAHYAAELESFLSNGELEQVSAFAPLVQQAIVEENAQAPELTVQRDLVTFAEAVLYRYYDAEPQRQKRVQRRVSEVTTASPLLTAASLTILSRAERALRLADIQQLAQKLPNHVEAQHLLATACEVQGDLSGARDAWAKVTSQGPAWLSHRFEQAKFEALRGESAKASKIAGQMLRIDPDSPWAKVAATAFSADRPLALVSIRGDAAVPLTTAVPRFFEQLEESLGFARRNNVEQAKRHLISAVDTIHAQAPFLLDAFDWFVAARQTELARVLVEMKAWPSQSEVAAKKARELANGFAEGGAKPKSDSKPTPPRVEPIEQTPSRVKRARARSVPRGDRARKGGETR